MRARDLIATDGADPFVLVEPPYNRNAPGMAAIAPEVTGYRLLQRIWTRLGWESLAGKALLDYGCGVRFVRTIHNLALPIQRYVGVDVDREMIAWLAEHLTDERFAFQYIDAANRVYNPCGTRDLVLDVRDVDAVCVHSVLTHHDPAEASATLELVRPTVHATGRLHFTAFTDETVDGYAEADPENPGHMSTYHPDLLLDLCGAAGWRVDRIHLPDPGGLGRTTFVATAG